MANKPNYKIRTNKKLTLVMLSGGIDSTSALWYVLHNPDKYGDIHVHHIHIQNIEARWRAEAEAVKNVVTYIRKHGPRPFAYTESTINTPSMGNKFMYDVEVVSYLTGYMTSRDPRITKVVIAATATDMELGIDGSVARGKRMHNAFHPEEKDHSARIKEYPQVHMTKEEVYKTLPPELAELTWSCRTPRYADGKPIECGKCKTCKVEMTAIKRLNSVGERGSK